ncbi:MAG: hypothetical protein K0Q59_1915 [Paenibacillus sp.]|nr:hypothetical protein [Paenibacillus sp.]
MGYCLHLALPYLNDTKESWRLRGSDQFSFKLVHGSTRAYDMVRDDEGNVYYSSSGTVTAVNRYGHLLWSYTIPVPTGVFYLTLGKDGTIYAFGNELLPKNNPGSIVYAFTKNGALSWVYRLTDLIPVTASRTAADANGNFILETDQGIVSINKKGILNWSNSDVHQIKKISDSFLSSNVSSLLTNKEGDVVVATRDKIIYWLGTDGKVQWTKDNPADSAIYLSDDYLFLLGSNGFDVYDSKGNPLDSDRIKIPYSLGLPTDYKGGYYISGTNGLTKIDGDGHELWIYPPKDPAYPTMSNIITDSFGNVYFSNNGNSVISLDEHGNERFIFIVQNSIFSTADLAVDSSGVVYLTTANGIGSISPIERSIRILNEERELYFPSKPVVYNGTTMLPMRELFESLGARVTWEPASQTISAQTDNMNLNLELDSNQAVVNDRTVDLETAPTIIDGSVWVSLQVVSKSFGLNVIWEQDFGEIQLHAAEPAQSSTIPPKPIKKTLFADAQDGYYLFLPENWVARKIAGTDGLTFTTGQDQYVKVEKVSKIDLSEKLSLDDFADGVGYNIDQGLENAEFSDLYDAPTQLGLDAVQFGVIGALNKYKVQYLVTLYESADSFYILHSWALASKYEEVHPVFVEISKQFGEIASGSSQSKVKT